MASINKRIGKDGKIVYRVRIQRKGHKVQTATFHNLTDARKWVYTTEAAILEHRHFPLSEAKRHTVGGLINRYLTDILPRKSATTVYAQTIQLSWWQTRLGHCLLSDITSATIAEYRDKLSRGDEKPRGSGTVNRYLAALSHAFTVATTEWQWIDQNPCLKVSRLKEPHGRVRYLDDNERQRLLDACKASRNPFLFTIVVTAISTGCRRNEILGLQWTDVDLQRGVITLRKTKNREIRSVPLTGYALELMRQHARVRRIDTPLVFPNKQGDKPMHIRTAFEGAVSRAKISNFVFHDLRHCAASYMALSGASLLDIASILGHRQIQQTKKYSHLTQRHLMSVVERMNTAIFG